MLLRVEKIIIDSSIGLRWQIHAFRVCACHQYFMVTLNIARWSLRHVIVDERTHVTSSQLHSGWKYRSIFQCSYSPLTSAFIQPPQISTESLIQVTRCRTSGNGLDRGGAQDELLSAIPWKPHADAMLLKNLEELCNDETQLAASGSSSPALESQIAQECCWYDCKEAEHLNRLLDC